MNQQTTEDERAFATVAMETIDILKTQLKIAKAALKEITITPTMGRSRLGIAKEALGKMGEVK